MQKLTVNGVRQRQLRDVHFFLIKTIYILKTAAQNYGFLKKKKQITPIGRDF